MVQIVTTVDDTEFWSNVFGSSFETWSWWRSVDYAVGSDWDIPGAVVLGIEDPEDEEGVLTKILSINDVARAYATYISGGPGADSWDNLDACSSDAILQIAVLGEIVYG